MTEEASPLSHQALKAQRTREKLIDATISLIKEGGFAAASSSRIAQRAGMTWGAAQHHFGSKEDILEAILARAYDSFLAITSSEDLRQGSLADRVHHFIDRMWQHYQGDLNHVSLEILLATRSDSKHPARAWEQRQGRAHMKVVREVFQDTRLSDARLREALTFTHCFLTGLSIESIFESRVRHLDNHLQRIKMALQIMLAGV